jgi:hypothetical protein
MENRCRSEPLLTLHRTDKAVGLLKVNADVAGLRYSAAWQWVQRLDF